MTIRKSWIAGCFLLGSLFSPALKAADKDYEFVEALLSPQAGFGFDEMANDAIKGMAADTSPQGVFDYKLAQALQLLTTAASSKVTPQKATELMAQAKAILEGICVGDNAALNHFELAGTMRASLKTKNIDLLTSVAHDLEHDDPKKAEEMRGQAAAEYDKLFSESEQEMLKAHETWFPKIKAYKDWTDSPAVQNAQEEVPVPADIARGLNDAWTHIMPPTNAWADYGLKAMRFYPKGGARRTEIMTKLTTYFAKKCEDEYDVNDLVMMTFNEFMGEAYGYAGDNAKMNEAFDEVFGVQDGQWADVAKRLSADIKKRAAFFMVSLNMDNKNYKEVETRVERLLFDNPLITRTDMGKQLTFDLATAKCLLPEGADYEEAKDLIVKLMDGMKADDPWINNARRSLSTVLDLAMQHGQMPTMPARRWYDAGRGFFAMASMADNQAKGLVDEGRMAEAAKKAAEARPLFFNAIKFYRNAISAERRGGDTLVQRMAVEPDCWNEMAFAYLRLKLNYEAMLSFKGLVESFRKEALDAQVKVSRNPDDRTLFTKPTDEQKKLLVDVNKKIADGRKFMLSIAGVILQEANTSYNRDIKQEMFAYVSGNDEDAGPGGAAVLNDNQEYQKVQLVYEQAEGAKSDARDYKESGKIKEAQQKFLESFKYYEQAADAWPKLPKTNSGYEQGLYMSAASHYQAYLLYALDTIRQPDGKLLDRKVRTDMLTQVGPKVIQGYEDFIAYIDGAGKANVLTDAEVDRRKRFKAAAYMTEPAVLLYLERFDDALKAIDGFFKFARANQGIVEAKQMENVNWTHYLVFYKKFDTLPTTADKVTLDSLQQMWDVVVECRNMAERFDATGHRFNQAAGAISSMAANGAAASSILVHDHADMESAIAPLRANFNKLSAQWFQKFIEGRDQETISIDNYYEAAERYKSAGMPEEAAGMYKKILDLFDKNHTGQRIPNKVIVDEMFKPMYVRNIDKPDTPYLKLRSKTASADVDKIKQLHKELLDYMVDDEANRTKAGDERWDIKDESSAEARNTIKKIRDMIAPLAAKAGLKPEELCESMSVRDDIAPGPWKEKIDGQTISYLDTAEREVNFRDLIYSVRYEYMTNMIAAVSKSADPKASAAQATTEMDIFTDIYGQGGVRLKMLRADLGMLTGVKTDYDNSKQLYFEVRQTQQPESLMYNRCSAGMLKCYLQVGQLDRADELMKKFTLTLTPPKIREFFPDFDDYKAQLESKGKGPYPEPVRHYELKESWDYRQHSKEEEDLAQQYRNKAFAEEKGEEWTAANQKFMDDLKAKVQAQYKLLGLDEKGRAIHGAGAEAPKDAPKDPPKDAPQDAPKDAPK